MTPVMFAALAGYSVGFSLAFVLALAVAFVVRRDPVRCSRCAKLGRVDKVTYDSQVFSTRVDLSQ